MPALQNSHAFAEAFAVFRRLQTIRESMAPEMQDDFFRLAYFFK
jgi:hypothetical protein